MGDTLRKPVTEKESTDESNDKLICGASSMQGWRDSHEDAHNCILDFDTDTSFFAVYDGHGSHEVAQYCSQKLPNFIKNTLEYKEGKIEEALIAGFLGFDASINTIEVVKVLMEICGIKKWRYSRYLKERNQSNPTVGTSSDSCSSSSSTQVDTCGDGVSSFSEAKTHDKNSNTNGPENVPEIKISVPDSSDTKEAAVVLTIKKDMTESTTQNGKISTPDSEAVAKSDVSSSPTFIENGAVSKKVKEKSFEDDVEGVNASIDASEEESSEEKEKEDSKDQKLGLVFAKDMFMVPGFDSGCTAVVALLRGNKLYVANAGDSRCIVCRNGKAIEMSFDHKPKNKLERERIVKAGGKVSINGRINGGLNLSRSIGDHVLKQNNKLSDKEQMITALPDIKTLTISPNKDEFMVLACDGIWDVMSNQKVVDFIRPNILEGRKKLSQICEDMFDHLLASDSLHKYDNMTAIIVKFKSNIFKRAVSPPSEQEKNDVKRVTTEAQSDA